MRWRAVALSIYWIVLATLTHYPRVRIPGEIPKSDKVIHFAAFALLALLCWLVMAARRPLRTASVWIAAAVLVSYASLDEYTQQFVGRHTDVVDWVANAAGITAMLTALEIRRRWPDK